MNIAVFGAKGRVGSKVVELAKKRGHTVLAIDIKDTEKNNEQYHAVPTSKTTSVPVDTEKIDAVIDFSTADATHEVCNFCKSNRCALISGVTGRNQQQSAEIANLSRQLPVVCKANFSVGVEILHRLCEIVAKELPDWDCEIVETHRKGKLDAPSGTAKSIATRICRQKSFKKVIVHALRCGSNFGRHEVTFATNGESLTLTHQAEGVEIFALGAIIEAENLKRS